MAMKTRCKTRPWRRCLREAEGYLALATLFEDQQLSLDQAEKSVLADLCLKTLGQLGEAGRWRPRVLYLSGQAHRLACRYRQAISDLNLAWQRNACNVHTSLALGWCYKRTGQMEQAIDALQNGLEVDGNSGILHYNLACYLALQDRSERALIHLARAIEIDNRFRMLAGDEADFDSLRNDPGFRELAEAVV